MSSEEIEIEKLLQDIIYGKVNIGRLMTWLRDYKVSSAEWDPLNRNLEINRTEFIRIYLKFLRNRFRNVLSGNSSLNKVQLDMRSTYDIKTGDSQQINLKVMGQDNTIAQCKIKKYTPLRKLMNAYCDRPESDNREEDKDSNFPADIHDVDQNYDLNFPALPITSTSTDEKIKRRIRPTTIASENQGNETDETSIITNFSVLSLNKHKENLYQNRFKSANYKSKKRTTQVSNPLTNVMKSLNYNLYNDISKRKKNIDKIIDIYNTLLNCRLVPSIFKEIKFLVNIIYTLPVDSMCAFDDITLDILSTINDWKYFCVRIIYCQEHILSRLDNKMKLHIVQRIKDISGEATHFQPTFLHETDSFENKNTYDYFDDSLDKMLDFQKYSSFLSNAHLKMYLEMKEKFNTFITNSSRTPSEEQFTRDLKFLDTLVKKSSITSYCFGHIFVYYLIKSLKETLNGSDSGQRRRRQLNSRLTMPLSAKPDRECVFNSSEIIYKYVLDFCLHKYVWHIPFIRYWLFQVLSDLTKEKHIEEKGKAKKYRKCALLSLKIKMLLGKFLGYIEFYDKEACITDVEKLVLIRSSSQIFPYVNIKEFLLQSVFNGCLTITIPWIVQFLCMADSITPFLPYYHDILFAITSIYLAAADVVNQQHSESHKCLYESTSSSSIIKTSIILPNKMYDESEVNYSEGTFVLIRGMSLLMIKFWISQIFECKSFGESQFFRLLNLYEDKLKFVNFKDPPIEHCVDTSNMFTDDSFLFICTHFSKIKYWNNEKSSCSIIKTVRPLSLQTNSLEINLSYSSINLSTENCIEQQTAIENSNINSIIKLIARRVFAIFESEYSNINKAKNSHGDLEEDISAIKLNCEKRISLCVEYLSYPGMDIYDTKTCIMECLKQFNILVENWCTSLYSDKKEEVPYFEEEDLRVTLRSVQETDIKSSIPEVLGENVYRGSTVESSGGLNHRKPLSSSFSKINGLMYELNSSAGSNQDVNIAVDEFIYVNQVLSLDSESQQENKSLLADIYSLSWNYILHLISTQPHLFTENLVDRMTSLWLKNKYGNNYLRILCPRTIRASTVYDKSLQKLISNNFGLLFTKIVIKKIITVAQLEEQFLSVLRHDWTKNELEFLNMTFASILDVFKDFHVENGTTISILEYMIYALTDIKNN